MKKEKSIAVILMGLILVIILSASSTVSAGKAYYWLVTDGITEPQSVFVEKNNTWLGEYLEQIADFKWYVDKGSSRGGSSSDLVQTVGGTKAELSMTGSGNNWTLIIKIYKGGANKPTAGPEVYQWNIFDGKDSDNDCILVVFTNTITGKTSKVVSLYENDVVTLGIPHVAEFTCRMWLN